MASALLKDAHIFKLPSPVQYTQRLHGASSLTFVLASLRLHAYSLGLAAPLVCAAQTFLRDTAKFRTRGFRAFIASLVTFALNVVLMVRLTRSNHCPKPAWSYTLYVFYC